MSSLTLVLYQIIPTLTLKSDKKKLNLNELDLLNWNDLG